MFIKEQNKLKFRSKSFIWFFTSKFGQIQQKKTFISENDYASFKEQNLPYNVALNTIILLAFESLFKARMFVFGARDITVPIFFRGGGF